MTTDVAIQFTNLNKQFDQIHAVKDLNFSIRRGEIFGLLGPNGAGKTTIIQMLLGLIPPTSGQIHVLGEPLYPLQPSQRRKLGVVLEQRHVYPELTAAAYLTFFGRLYGVVNLERRIDELLEQVDLTNRKDSRVGGFSRGMRLKLEFARATLHDPEILILDEPVEGLDPYGIQEVRGLLMHHHQQGNTIILCSHILSEVEQIANRVGIMNQGRMLAIGDMQTLRSHLEPENELLLEVDGSGPRLIDTLRKLPYVRAASQQNGLFSVRVSAESDFRANLARAVADEGAVVVEMKRKDLSLEQAFTRITTGNVTLLAAEQPGPVQESVDRHSVAPDASAKRFVPILRDEGRGRVVRTLFDESLAALLNSPAPYFALAVTMLVGAVSTRSYLGFVARNDLIVLPRPWYLPFLAGALLMIFWLAFSTTMTVVHERASGSLQLLFVGPVDEIAYFGSLFLSRLVTFVLWNVLFALALLAFGSWSGLTYGWDLLSAMLYAMLPFSILTALGLLVAALVRSVRGAAVVFLALAGGLAGLLATRNLLTGLSLGERSFALSYVRDALTLATQSLRWISPYEYLLQGIEAISLPAGLLLILAGALYALLLFVGAVLLLRKRTVLP